MTGAYLLNQSYSGFTWSLLKDSGWYGIDLINSDPFSAGLNSGCDYLQTCFSKKNDGYYCN